jgi:hypothetical protein
MLRDAAHDPVTFLFYEHDAPEQRSQGGGAQSAQDKA